MCSNILYRKWAGFDELQTYRKRKIDLPNIFILRTKQVKVRLDVIELNVLSIYQMIIRPWETIIFLNFITTNVNCR